MKQLVNTTLRWATCSESEFGNIGETRHLVQRGSPRSFCGKSLKDPNIWRVDGVKPKCAICEKEESKEYV